MACQPPEKQRQRERPQGRDIAAGRRSEPPASQRRPDPPPTARQQRQVLCPLPARGPGSHLGLPLDHQPSQSWSWRSANGDESRFDPATRPERPGHPGQRRPARARPRDSCRGAMLQPARRRVCMSTRGPGRHQPHAGTALLPASSRLRYSRRTPRSYRYMSSGNDLPTAGDHGPRSPDGPSFTAPPGMPACQPGRRPPGCRLARDGGGRGRAAARCWYRQEGSRALDRGNLAGLPA